MSKTVLLRFFVDSIPVFYLLSLPNINISSILQITCLQCRLLYNFFIFFSLCIYTFLSLSVLFILPPDGADIGCVAGFLFNKKYILGGSHLLI
jgi:hypothetical protein